MSQFYLSPGVYTKETDLTQAAAAIATSSAAVVGYSNQGPVNQRILCVNKSSFIQQFGTPTPGNTFHYSALAYLENGNQLWATRVMSGSQPALRGGVVISCEGSTYPTSYDAAFPAGVPESAFVNVGVGRLDDSVRSTVLSAVASAGDTGTIPLFYIFGTNPGSWNNNIAIEIRANGRSAANSAEQPLQPLFPDSLSQPYTFNIVVWVKDSTGVPSVAESWTVSRQPQVDARGNQLYLEDVINGNSQYIVVVDNSIPVAGGSSPISGEAAGTTANTGALTYQTAHANVAPGSLVLTDASANTVSDNGLGGLVTGNTHAGVPVVGSSVNYATGQIVVTAAAGLAHTSAVTAAYNYSRGQVNTVMPVAWVASYAPSSTPLGPLFLGPVNGSTTATNLNGGAVIVTDVIGTPLPTTGWQLYMSPELVDVRTLIGGGWAGSAVSFADMGTLATAINAIAVSRKDCVAVFDVPYSVATITNGNSSTSVATASVNYRTGSSSPSSYSPGGNYNLNSSYAALYSPWVKDVDDYNGVLLSLPPSGYVAGQYAYNDQVGQPWTAPAGPNRGVLPVVALTTIFQQGDRDLLSPNEINPIQVRPGQGIQIFDMLTQQAAASDLQKLNIRRSLIVIEKTLAVALQQFLFENNLPSLQLRVTTVINSALQIMGSNGAFQTTGPQDPGYFVQCNSTNNTPATIDANELIVSVFVKPVQAVRFIQLNVIVTPTGTSFAELIAQGL